MELDVVADIDVEQVVADQAGGDLSRSPGAVLVILLLADLHLEQVVAGGRRLVERKVALPEGMDQAHAHEPVVVAPVGAAADSHRRDARDVAAVREGGAHEVVLAVDAKDARRQWHQVPLPGDFAAAEDGVAPRIDGLQEFGADAAGREIRAAGDAGELPEDEVVVAGIERLGVETKTSLRPLEADFGGVGGLDFQVRIADLERAGCVMGAVGEELEHGGRPLDALKGRAGDHAPRQILEDAETDALGHEAECTWQ